MFSPATATSTRTGDQALVREINRSIILNALRDRAPISRAKLATATGLNKGTVSSLVKDLLDAQFVHEIGLGKNAGGGRPAIMLELNPRAGCILGVEVSPDFISGILTDFAAKILWLLENPEERKRMGEYGRRRIEAELAWKYSEKHLLDAYQRAFSKQ